MLLKLDASVVFCQFCSLTHVESEILGREPSVMLLYRSCNRIRAELTCVSHDTGEAVAARGSSGVTNNSI